MRSAALGDPLALILTAVPTFPRARHSSACGGGAEETDLQAARSTRENSTVMHPSPPVETSPQQRRESEELAPPVLFGRGPR